MHLFLKAISIQASQHSQLSSQLLIQINWMLIKNETAPCWSPLNCASMVLLPEIPIEARSLSGRAVFGEVTISNHLFCFILCRQPPNPGHRIVPQAQHEAGDELCATAEEASWEAGCLTLPHILSWKSCYISTAPKEGLYSKEKSRLE